MSTLERGPQPSRYNKSSSSVAGDGMRLAKKLEGLGQTNVTEEPRLPSIDAFNEPYVDDSSESSPFFEAMVQEHAETIQEPEVSAVETADEPELSPVESSVQVSTSRLANLLRRSANRLDSSSERFDDMKSVAKKKLGAFGRAALRSTSALDEFALGTSAAIAEKGVAIGTNLAAKGLAVTDRADIALVNKAAAVGATVKNTYGNTLESATGSVADIGVALLDGKDKITGSIENTKTGAKNRLVSLKEASVKRRQARREFWASTKASASRALDQSAGLIMSAGEQLEKGMDIVGTKMINGQEAVAGKIERGKNSVEATRARGRAILDATSVAQAEQNQL